jgi:hypothetical protein
MNITDILTTVSGLLNSSSVTVSSLAAQTQTASEQLKLGTLTEDEYREIIGDIQTEQLVKVEASNIAEQQVLASLFSEILSASEIML